MRILAHPVSRQTATSACLRGVGTAVPRNIPQSCIAELVRRICCASDPERQWTTTIFDRSGVGWRGSVLLDEPEMAGLDHDRALERVMRGFYPPRTSGDDRGPTTAARLSLYARHAPALAQRAAAASLDNAAMAPGQITHLITVSCTGFFAPGLDAALIESLGLSPSVTRVQVGFMGCHGTFNALAAASAIVRADPAAVALVCCVELCTLHLAYGWDPQKVVANALFADGAAAAVIAQDTATPPAHGAHPGPWRLRDTASLLVPDSREAMTWTIGDHGFAMTLSPKLPGLIRGNLRAWLEPWLARHGLALEDVPAWAVHPGGPRVLSGVADALQLPAGALSISHEVLWQHGNMSSATVLFILQQLRRNKAAGPCVALGFGPGLMAEALLLE